MRYIGDSNVNRTADRLWKDLDHAIGARAQDLFPQPAPAGGVLKVTVVSDPGVVVPDESSGFGVADAQTLLRTSD